MEKVILVEDAVLRDTFWNAAIDLKKENDELKQHNNDLERRLLALWEKYHSDSNYCIERINRLEDIINRAHLAFFSDSSHRKVSIAMHRILDEEVRKESR